MLSFYSFLVNIAGHLSGTNRGQTGDKRKDENVIVSQPHGSLLQFQNQPAEDNKPQDFAKIQRQVRRPTNPEEMKRGSDGQQWR